MKVKPFLAVSALTAALLAPMTASADDNLLTGDVRLACEAVLCLSSGNRPSECAPSIKRYFSINHKKLSDTINARRSFLNLCPSGNAQGMPQLIDAIANGAGRCDAAALNRRGHYTGSSRDGTRRFIVNMQKPDYCKAYENHAWTRVATTKLEPIYCNYTTGDTPWRKKRVEKYQCGQKWVDVK
ncbi:TrbM/KikA/MpfK family conjugal transfer protein [Kingella kingae]|uniref:TrbM n=1 Tax=Kingella negevensis TaxID=1522312 RepID=A0A238TCQ0_9NEIS|nr:MULTISPECIES: TrbM/KikA/MpfK family conjugal transfer protein [Kingella]MDK4563732.1 TrbM/KikA/MpfK family conjugal transfer protein [Kingella kingae]MDK4578333.1 TrbM/KikA/MpfK family conjugal transfer protein [Kingella kingae]MDK4608381.1 TrbM/KikA/MpfK family conjugal transfer protein [Kingella kingae]MDK4625735.1 TrbM/KikA/MpfK family conjugal transfer protein [Kingella kingae]MDK4673555.1 TrbM/KikA/MpfK family conjugal transfer protein [Kingella kingae]